MKHLGVLPAFSLSPCPAHCSPVPCLAFKVTSILTSPPTYTLRTCLFPAHLLPFYSSLFFFPRRHRPCHHPLPMRPRHDRQGGGQHAEQEVRVPGAVGWVLWPFCACILKGNLAFSCVYFEGGCGLLCPAALGSTRGLGPNNWTWVSGPTKRSRLFCGAKPVAKAVCASLLICCRRCGPAPLPGGARERRRARHPGHRRLCAPCAQIPGRLLHAPGRQGGRSGVLGG